MGPIQVNQVYQYAHGGGRHATHYMPRWIPCYLHTMLGFSPTHRDSVHSDQWNADNYDFRGVESENNIEMYTEWILQMLHEPHRWGGGASDKIQSIKVRIRDYGKYRLCSTWCYSFKNFSSPPPLLCISHLALSSLCMVLYHIPFVLKHYFTSP